MAKQKLLSFMLTIALFVAGSITAFAQQVSLKGGKMSLRQAFQRIEQASTYKFQYNSSQVDGTRQVTLPSGKTDLKKVLASLRSITGYSYSIRGNYILVEPRQEAATASSSKRRAAGYIKDENGEPVIGASIKEKGSKNGAITDINGYFSFDVDPESTLLVTYIGYKPQEVRASNNIDLQLTTENETLNEIVVVGYGTQKKSDLTGGIVQINSDKLDEVTTNNLLDKLIGQVPGLNITTTNASPGSDQSIRVRGENSLSADNSPLIIFDGIPYSGSLGDIDPDIIESLTVLKDASSAAIYGSRGSNGVILIQSKRGKMGAATVSYKGQIGLREVQNKLDVMGVDEYLQLKKDYYAQNYNYTADQLDPMNILNPNERTSYQNGQSVDWQDLIYRTALTHDNQVSISGGTESTKYMASLSHLYEEGVMENTGLKRTNVSINVTQDLGSWLTIGIGTHFAQKDIDDNAPDRESAVKQSPLGIYKDEDGKYIDYPMDETLYPNPMSDIDATTDKVHRNLFISSFAEVKLPVKGLSYRTNFGYNYRSKDEGSYYGRNTLTGKQVDGYAKIYNQHYSDYTWENLLKYNQTFGLHKIDATGLFSIQETKNKTNTQTAESFVNDDSEYHNMNAGEKNQTVASSLTETSTVSYMFRVNYSYANRYLLTLTGRTDGYSAFGKNNKYAFFPSAALAWVISSEKFMDSISSKWLSYLKLRLSYGANGNQAISPYQTLDRLSLTKYIWGDGGTTVNGSFLPANGVGNPNLKWETTRTFNVGLDFSLWNGRLSGNIDFYVANTSDLLMSRQVPIMNGFSSIMDNIGKTRNKGIEIALNSINLQNKDFKWTTNVNFALNRDKIIELRGDGQDDIDNKWFIGHPLRVYYDYNVVGIWQTDDPRWDATKKKYLNSEGKEIQAGAKPGAAMIEDVDGNGIINSKDRKIIGSRLPSFTLSMGNTLTYKDLSLSFILDGVFGVTKERKDLNLERWDMKFNYLSGYKYWTPENPSNEITSLTYTPYAKHTWYDKVNYVQVKNITLAYRLRREWLKTIGIQAATVNLSVNNLCSFSNVDNTVNLDATDMYFSYPINRSYMLGVNVTF